MPLSVPPPANWSIPSGTSTVPLLLKVMPFIDRRRAGTTPVEGPLIDDRVGNRPEGAKIAVTDGVEGAGGRRVDGAGLVGDRPKAEIGPV